MKKLIAVVCSAFLVSTLSIAPVSAQQSGLVNVQIGDISTGDILSDIDVNVGLGLNIAANVCGVAVSVLAQELGQTGVARCETAEQFVDITRL